MRKFKFLLLTAVVATPLTVGCGGSSETAPVANDDDIEAFLAENPDMAVDLEEEAGLMESDQAIEE